MLRLLCRFSSVFALLCYCFLYGASAADRELNESGQVLPEIRLLDQMALAKVSRVLGSSRTRAYFTQPQPIYISGAHTEQSWGIYRPLALFSPHQQSMQALRLVARASLTASGGARSTLHVTSQSQEIRPLDIALPAARRADIRVPTQHAEPAAVSVLGTPQGLHYAVRNDWLVLDKGAEEKLVAGQRFALFQRAAPGADIVTGTLMTDLAVGSLVVEQVYPHLSLARITASSQVIDNKVVLRALADDTDAVSGSVLNESP
ncbi:hypothetical protein [Vibrio ostreae]|uniref:Flagella basal body P-ring formation protein FlgA n=1 Tax=Vibrio ostreae TaxID=2841925 RepID=A0A975U901_9VIBR|nr:hypothetical protein [Vibrio ostreae]QXO17347.1 hypothetical protein KNV97_18480 [Vibrio ostreae]